MQPFDILESPLEGRTLIEASAGTGKTFTIAALYLRLLLERRLHPRDILVVTFTEAATEELRGRIRGRIREALALFDGGESDDPFLCALAERHSEEGRARLGDALRGFDEAAVFTIHGFCQRVLQENAFESGSRFDTELITDQTPLVREIVEDFWRKAVYDLPVELAELVAAKRLKPSTLLSFLGNRPPAPFLRVVPEACSPDLASLAAACRTAFLSARSSWESCRREVGDILLSSPALNRNSYRAAGIPGWMEEMEGYLNGGNPFRLFERFDRFCTSKIASSTKNGHEPPCHDFFDCCSLLDEALKRLDEGFSAWVLALRRSLLEFLSRELAARKQTRNVRSFDDILTDLYDALAREGGERLARSVRERFPAALIDEFQDTDPVQYRIFRSLYPAGSGAALFLIGDPKQAIYSFRGADIFAYLEAAREVDRSFTLHRNWRSSPSLVKGVNALFSFSDNPFVFEDIAFSPVEAACGDASDEASPLRLWFVEREGGTPIAGGAAIPAIAASVASEIVRILTGGDSAGERSAGPGDIAVLVRRHSEARVVQEALRQAGLPSVLCNAGNLFASREARDCLTIMKAVAEPENEGLIRRALASETLGRTAAAIAALREDESGWSALLERFRAWHDLWNEKSFIVMSRALMADEGVRGRLLSCPDGERRLTNLLHCFELLNQAAHDEGLGMEGLVAWLAAHCSDKRERDEYQVRLETDEQAIKIVTVHKSKGLEYPIVFCPFLWSGSKEKGDTFLYHDRDSGGAVLDLGSQGVDEAQRLAEEEALAENIRLAYVALTRAKYRCYLVWGAFRNAGTSSLARILHGEEGAQQEQLSFSDAELRQRLELVAGHSEGTILVTGMPPGSGEVWRPDAVQGHKLVCREFDAVIPRDWRVASFSRLISDRSHAVELPDRDSLRKTGTEEPVQEDFRNFMNFPSGAEAGSCLHEIFENSDFCDHSSDDALTIVRDRLMRYGFDTRWEQEVLAMVGRVLTAPLSGAFGNVRLSGLSQEERIAEMEFYLPLETLTHQGLAERVREIGGEGLAPGTEEMFKRLSFTPVRGMLKGYVDLIFCREGRYYIVDWKSNRLGRRAEDYCTESLREAMEREFYLLQYHLYAAALHLYLHRSLPGYEYERHFGGVFYLFLRGIDPAAEVNPGVFYDRPSLEMVDGLASFLTGRGEAAP